MDLSHHWPAQHTTLLHFCCVIYFVEPLLGFQCPEYEYSGCSKIGGDEGYVHIKNAAKFEKSESEDMMSIHD